MDGFDRSLAFLVAIEDYDHGIPKLATPVADATELAEVLRTLHGFETEIVTDQRARKLELEGFLDELQWRVGPDDRVLFYFAGHGIALGIDGEPQGFILPQDARKDADARASFIAMQDLHERLSLLPCRHLLVVLDCCFAGAFRWSGSRATAVVAESLHQERYKWFIEDPAWQVIASAAHDQEAIDVAARQPLGNRETAGNHSPFALALIDGLRGNADRTAVGGQGDGIITATELFQHVEDAMREQGASLFKQTPILWLLKKHDKGQFVFLVPGRSPDELPPGPELNEQANPWRGLESYEERHSAFFFGRNAASETLAQRLLGTGPSESGAAHDPERFLVVTGPSGVGKSSLVKAGMLPRLPKDRMRSIVLRPSRPGPNAFASLAAALQEASAGDFPSPGEQGLRQDHGSLADWIGRRQDTRDLVLVVDQLEEVVTSGTDTDLPYEFMKLIETTLARTGSAFRVVFTVRPEYEPHFVQSALKARWHKARFLVPQMTQDELRRVIEGPAARQTMRFESDRLVDALVNDVVNMPGALPLLSFALSQMYLKYLVRRRDNTDRVLSEADYLLLLDEDDRSQATVNLRGGVTGALRLRANQVIQEGDREYQLTARRVLERLVSIEGGEFARRRTPGWEFEVNDPAEQARVKALLERLRTERLVVVDSGRDGSPVTDGREAPAAVDTGTSYELAHDALIHIWRELSDWVRGDSLLIADLRNLTTNAIEWHRSARSGPVWDERVEIAKITALRSAPSPGLNSIELAFAKASQKRSARNRTVFWAAVLALVATTMGVISSAYLAVSNSVESQRQADIGQSQRFATLGRADLENDPRASVLFAAHAVKRAAETPERELPGWGHALWSLIHEDQLGDGFLPEAEQVLREALAKQGGTTFCCHQGEIDKIAVSRDGGWIATADENHRVRLWDEKDPVPSRSTPVWLHSEGALLELGFSEGSRWVVVATEKGVWLWPPSTGSNELLMIAAAADLTGAALSPTGRWLVTASRDALELWDLALAAPEPTRKVLAAAKPFYSVSFDAEERLLAIRSEGRIELWRIGATPAEFTIRLGKMENEARYLHSIGLSQDGRWLVATIYNGSAYLWDLSVENPEPRFLPHPRPAKIRGQQPYRIGALAFSADGRWLATASTDHSARLWPLGSPESGEPVRLLRGYDDNDDEYTPTETSVAISPDSRWLAVTGSGLDHTYVWDLQSDKLSENDATELPNGDQVQIDAAGRWLAVTYTGNVYLWPLSSVSPPSPDSMIKTRFTGQSAGFSSDGAVMVTALYEKAYSWQLSDVGLFGLAASPEQIVADGSDIAGNSNALVSPDGHWLVAANPANAIRLVDLARDPLSDVELDGGLRRTAGYPPVTEVRPGPYEAAFDPTGSKLAVANELAVEVWNLSDGRVRLEARFAMPSSDSGHYSRLAISPDGRRLALAQKERAWLWDLDPAARRDAPIELTAHQESIEYLAFSSDSRTLVTQALMWGFHGSWQAGQGMEVFFWNVTAPTSPSRLGLAPADIESFAPDAQGRWIFTATPDGGRLWDLQGATGAPLGRRLDISRDQAAHVLFPRGRGLMVTGPASLYAEQATGARLWTIGADPPEPAAVDLSGYLGRSEYGQGHLSPDGRFLVTSEPNHDLYVWDLDKASASMSPKRISWSGTFADDVTFSANSKRFAVRGGDRLEVFDLSSEEPGRVFSISSSSYAMRLDASGSLLLTSGDKIWRLNSAAPTVSAVTLPNLGILDHVVFTPDSRWLLDMNSGVRGWPLTTAQLLETAKGVVGENFARQRWNEHSPDTPYEKTFDDLP